MRKLLALLLAGTLLVSPALAAEGPGFSDVSPDDWFAPYVEVCVEEGLMEGTGGGRFSPEQYVTAAECVMLAVRLDRLQKGLEGPLPAAPEGWGTVVITDEGGEIRFTLEDYEGYSTNSKLYTICLPLEKVKPLEGKPGRLTLNGDKVFEGTFTAEETPHFPRVGLTFQANVQMSSKDLDDIIAAYSMEKDLVTTPTWAVDGLYYAKENALDLGFLHCDLTPANRRNFLTALEGIADPRKMEMLNTVEALPDIPVDVYSTWTDGDRNGTHGNFGDFYRAGILSGTDPYGTFNGSWPLTRAEAAAMLARILRPELRLTFTLTPYPWERTYELTELGVSSEDWWNNDSYYLAFPALIENPLDLQVIRVSQRKNDQIIYNQDGIFSVEGPWLVEPGRYAEIGNFGLDGLALVENINYGGQGVIDSQGQEVLPPVYDLIYLGGDGIITAYSQKDNTYFLFDAKGQPVEQFTAEGIQVWGAREGLALYQDENSRLWGYLDLEGNVAIPAQFETAGLFYDGLAAVVLDGKTGYIGHDGALAIPTQFDAIRFYHEGHFQNGAAIVTDSNGHKMVINKEGEQLSPHKYDLLDTAFSPNGLAFYQVRSDPEEGFLQGFVDTNGVEHPLPTYSSPYQIMAYSGGYYLVYWSLGGVYNYMDDTGSLLSPTWFDEATPMTEDGRAIVLHQGQYCRLQLK